MDEEVWMSVPGFGGHYEASNLGRIRVKDRVIVKPHPISRKLRSCLYRGRLLHPCDKDKYGYQVTCISVDGVRKRVKVHRFVLSAFCGPCPEGMESLHLDGNPRNNAVSNLRWGTRAENMKQQWDARGRSGDR